MSTDSPSDRPRPIWNADDERREIRRILDRVEAELLDAPAPPPVPITINPGYRLVMFPHVRRLDPATSTQGPDPYNVYPVLAAGRVYHNSLSGSLTTVASHLFNLELVAVDDNTLRMCWNLNGLRSNYFDWSVLDDTPRPELRPDLQRIVDLLRGG